MKRSSKYPDEVKRKAVQEWVTGKKTYQQISSELKIGKGQLSQWKVAILKKEAAADDATELVPTDPTAAPSPQRQLPIAELVLSSKNTRLKRNVIRPQAIADFHGGMSAPEVADKYGVNVSTVYAWLKSFRNTETAVDDEAAAPEPSARDMPVFRSKKEALGPQAAADYHGGMPAKQVAAKYGVTDATVYTWSKAFPNAQPASAIVSAPAQNGRKAVMTHSPLGTAPNVRDAISLLRKAVARMNTLHCPHCGQEFVAKPQGLTENLVGMAHLFLEGEG